jgi:hypothetical protein
VRNNIENPSASVNILSLLFITWGCVMFPLWGLGLYYSFKEGPIEVQGLVMSSAALVVSLCLIVSPLFRRNAAITALIFSSLFTVANFVYNTGSINQMSSGLIWGILCLVLPSVFLLRLSMPRPQTFATTTFATATQRLSYREAGLIIL